MPKLLDDLYRVTTPYMCCGLLVRGGVVRIAAPIMKWSVGKSITDVRSWVESKGYKMSRIVKKKVHGY